jgi:hypothetical protein
MQQEVAQNEWTDPRQALQIILDLKQRAIRELLAKDANAALDTL